MNIREVSQALLLQGWKRCLLVLLAALPAGAFAQANLNVLFTNGPASNRVNVVVFSEGYQTNQLPQFLTNAAITVSNLLSVLPYSEYSNYFNAYAVSVASTNSGSNHSMTSNTNKSYFHSSYNSDGIPQLITIPPNEFGNNVVDNNASDGTGKVQALLTNSALYAATNLAVATNVLNQITPSNRFVVLVVNDSTYGGSGQPPNPTNPLPIAITSLGSSNGIPASRIIIHESGHTIGGLADEYTNAYAALSPVERPNATAFTNTNQIPWVAWITNYDVFLGVTPDIPTANDNNGAWANAVGDFQGAEYNTSGWYRPMEDCIMNHLYENLGFCDVCMEALVKAIYQKVDSVDSFSPATNNPGITTTNAFAFSIVPLRPATHSLGIQWFTNGVAVPNATNSAFMLLPASFTNGPCSVQAQTLDTTVLPSNFLHPYLVLSDPNHYLSNAVSWNVTIGLTTLKLLSPRGLGGGQFAFTVSGTAPAGFVIQASTDLTNWVSLSTNSLSGGVFNYTNAAGISPRFYRTLSP